MAGITDLPTRRIVAGFGAGLVVSEMVASEELVKAQGLARSRAELGFGEAASTYFLGAYWTQPVLFATFILILVLRPNGLIGKG